MTERMEDEVCFRWVSFALTTGKCLIDLHLNKALSRDIPTEIHVSVTFCT